jgi:bud site selection protein 31
VHQINWQRTRYVHDMFYKYGKVSQAVYDYCCKNRMIDAALSAKWLEPGYENLCSLHVIDPKNHTFMTASICRVPKQNLPPGTVVSDPYSGCKGCASGSAGQANIFGNKYGQKLAAIQIRREQLLEKELAQEEQKALDEAAERKKRKKDKKKQKKQRDGLWANEEEEEAAAPEERPD